LDSNQRPSGYEPDELPLLHPASQSHYMPAHQFRQTRTPNDLVSEHAAKTTLQPVRSFLT
jgi:hypothetical protein